MKTNKIGLLVYNPERKRKKTSSFDSNSNMGARVVIELIRIKNSQEVDFCSAATAHNYEIVLVPFTSTYDVYAFYKEVALREDWQPKNRKFTVVGGGFGMQNPTTIRNYVDYAVFGRAEGFLHELIDSLLGGSIFEHPSVMKLPNIYKVKIGQAEELMDLDFFHERFVGCVRKCKFCHYTWMRKPTLSPEVNWIQGGEFDDGYKVGSKASIEVMLKEVKNIDKKYGRVRAALDGYSERLRFLYGKKITSEDFIEAVEHVGSFDKASFFDLYNIGSLPSETDEDREELSTTLRRIKPKNTVILVVTVTPFRPSLATPMQFAPVSLFPDYSKMRLKPIVEDTPNLRAVYSLNESSFSHLQTIIVERATIDTDALFHAVCFSPALKRLNVSRKLKLLQNHFDLSPYLREYDVDEEKYPGWFLESYTSQEMLKQAYLWTKERRDKKWQNRKFV